MVLFETRKSSSNPRRGSTILDYAFALDEIFFNLCKGCVAAAMSCVPPSAFSAGRIREATRDMKSPPGKSTTESPIKYFHTKFMELSPLKYNSKLMNSIWGFYNRYSPHNVKKVSEPGAPSGEMQPSAAISPNKSEPVLNLPPHLDNMWASIKVSQSH